MKNLVKVHRINSVKMAIPDLTQISGWLAEVVTLFV
jgi:hypothetical protein